MHCREVVHEPSFVAAESGGEMAKWCFRAGKGRHPFGQLRIAASSLVAKAAVAYFVGVGTNGVTRTPFYGLLISEGDL